MGTGININRLMVSRNLKKRREATERAMKMEIKTRFDIDMSKGNWSFPCCPGIKKYVVRDKSDFKDFKIKSLEIFFEETDEALSVSTDLQC